MKNQSIIILIFLALLGSSCGEASPTLPPDTTSTPLLTTATLRFSPTLPSVEEATPTATIAAPTIHTEEPIRFTFPTPGPQPVSLWRPPLYPIPWALGAHDHFLFIRPIAADQVNWPLSSYRYGYQVGDSSATHSGIDIDAASGSPVLAAAPGIVLWAGYGIFSGIDNPEDPYGLAVLIRHDFGYNGQKLYTAYGHMDRVDVIKGQRVTVGEQLGLVGNTGRSTGPHLHFEIRLQKSGFLATFNPELWLAPPQGWGILAGRFEGADGSLLTNLEVTVRSRNSPTPIFRTAQTYGAVGYNSDPYYHENLVLADLPAGSYLLSLTMDDLLYRTRITINPGAVTYINFKQGLGYTTEGPIGITDDTWVTEGYP
jgi:murein DD-endopeptidase MepM/ murein hydrolase activator NlpD